MEEVDNSKEGVEDDAKTENTTAEEAAVADVSVAVDGDTGSVTVDDINAGEPVAEDVPTEDEKHEIDEYAAAETAVVSEGDAAMENATSADAADDVVVDDDDDDDDDDDAEVTSEVEKDESKEMAMQPPDETVSAITSSDVEEKLEAEKADSEAIADTETIADAEAKAGVEATADVEAVADAEATADEEAIGDATTERVERVTSKADKVTVSVEIPKTGEAPEGGVVSNVVTVTKYKAYDTATAVNAVNESEASDTTVNKTTQDVLKMAGNDELKFGVLISLVHVGQFSNKDVVDSVLSLVSSGGTFCGHFKSYVYYFTI